MKKESFKFQAVSPLSIGKLGRRYSRQVLKKGE
jgi:hypothetical protein